MISSYILLFTFGLNLIIFVLTKLKSKLLIWILIAILMFFLNSNTFYDKIVI